jgi:hypothetical protein
LMSITSTVLAIFASRCGDKTRKSQKARDVFALLSLSLSLSLSCRTKHPVLSRAADAQGKGGMVPEFGGTVRLQGFGIGDFIRGLTERTKGASKNYQAPWTSSLQVELVGQDNQNVDVDIPFDTTLETLALTTSTAHKEENAKEKSTAEGDDLLLLAPKAQLVFGSRSQCRESALVPFAVPVMADRPFAEMIKRHPLRLVRRRSSGSRCDDVVARSSYQPLQQ